MTKQRMHDVLKDYAIAQLNSGKSKMSPEEWVTLLNCYAAKKSAASCAQRLQRPDVNVNVWYCRISMALTMDALMNYEVE